MNYNEKLEREYIFKVEELFERELGFIILDTYEGIQLGVNYRVSPSQPIVLSFDFFATITPR